MSPSRSFRPVRRRRVFFIPGYDPMPPRAHRERYRREAARQADFSGHEIAVARRAVGRRGWRVDARIEGQGVETTVEVLHWADIVRASMARGVGAGLTPHFCRTAWIYLSSGALFRLMRLRKGPVIAALFPGGGAFGGAGAGGGARRLR
jgi:hypothetical protein